MATVKAVPGCSHTSQRGHKLQMAFVNAPFRIARFNIDNRRDFSAHHNRRTQGRKARTIGIMTMIDAGKKDHKIIAVATNDPEFNSYREAAEMPPHRLSMLRRE